MVEEGSPQNVYDNEGKKPISVGTICAEEDIVGMEYIPGEEKNKPSTIDDNEEEELNWCRPNCRKESPPERKPGKEKRRRRRKYRNHK
jgi:hypothetical protein